MKKTALFSTLAALVLSAPADALTPQQEQMKTCNAEATQKGLKGSERQTFMSQCLGAKPESETSGLTPQQAKMKTCNADAKGKGLKGTERKAFMQECLSK